MPKLQLTLATLGQLDRGAAELAINDALAAAVSDLENRGEDSKARVVEIKVRLTKAPSGIVDVEVEAGAKVPAYRTRATACQIGNVAGQPILNFQENSPDHPDQEDLPFRDRRGDK